MCCQTCPYRMSCANTQPTCYVPKPYGLIQPNYPYPWITSDPGAGYY